MKKQIMPTICAIGLMLSNYPSKIYALDNSIETNELEKKNKEYNNIYNVENIDLSEYEETKQESTYINISDENLQIAINEALYKDNLNEQVTLKEMYSLEYLNLNNKNIENLSGIEFAKNLKKIDLSYNKIEEIRPLSSLILLEELNLSDNEITDISNIKYLKNLKRLDLSNVVRNLNIEDEIVELDDLNEDTHNSIKNISPISDLPNLVELNLSNNEISDISPLLNLNNLQKLNLSGNSISNISDINKIKSLINLNLSNQVIINDRIKILENYLNLDYSVTDEKNNTISPSFISKAGVLDGKTIKWINLDEYVSDLEIKFGKEIKLNESLETYFSGKIIQSVDMDSIIEIEDVVLLNSINTSLGKNDLNLNILKSEMESLESLEITNSNLESLKGLENAINLKELVISNTNISNFENISNLSNLIKLDLNNNKIKNIDFLNKMSNLEYLNLESNSITNTNSIKYNLSLLKELNLSNNNLYSVDLRGLNNVYDLDLSKNHINQIDGIEELNNLQILNLNNNNISDISMLSTLENLSRLSVENQVVYLPMLKSGQIKFSVKNPVLNIDKSLIKPVFVSEGGFLDEGFVCWDKINKEINFVEFNFSDNIEKNNVIIGNFSGNVVQPLNIELFSEDEYLGLSLSTNQIKFENFTGIEDMEQLNAVEINVDSNKSYDIYALIPNEITNSIGDKILSPTALSMRESTSPDYIRFENINEKLLLMESVASGVNTHKFDFKLNKDSFSDKDSYRAVIRFEINQK